MITLQGILGLAIGVVGLVSGQPLLILVSLLTFMALFLKSERDFAGIKEVVGRLVNSEDSGAVRPDELVLSSRAKDVVDNLVGVSARMNALTWELDPELKKNTVSFDSHVRVDDFVPEDLFEELLNFAETRFRAKSCAIVFKRQNDSAWTIKARKGQGARFDERLSRFAALVFSPNGEQFCGIKENADAESLITNFEHFAIRQTIVSKFEEHDQFGIKGVFWLGYAEGKVPTATELSWAEGLCRFINLQLNTKTKIKDLHGELRRAQIDTKAQTRFFADLSHDVRTPLNNLKNILALVKFEETSSETRSMLEAAIDNCDHVADMMEDILIYSQSQAGAISSNRRALCLGEQLRRIVGAFKGSAELKGLPIRIGEIPQEAVVSIDPKHFRRVISNLLSNALKYTERGEVLVSVECRAPQTWSVFVRDTGVGIDHKDLGRLFAPFDRLERTRGIEGIGLGLALSKILAQANGAELLAASKLGVGTEFEFRIPRGADVYSIAPESIPSGKNLILMIDDDTDYLQSSAKILTRLGYEVLTASSGKEGVSVMKLARPSVVITDGSMEEGGGEYVCREASELGIPTVVVSGKNHPEFVSLMTRLGAKKVCLKPIEMTELSRIISFEVLCQPSNMSKIA
jgi:signal transduction histidine kinase